MKVKIVIALTMLVLGSLQVPAYQAPVFPYAPAAGVPGSTAIGNTDPDIEGWAIEVVSIQFGEEVSEEWRDVEQALGPASGIAEDVLVLGRGGEVVLAFEGVIQDGEGFDFAVFENAFSNTFLELAFVEVSSDGVHFVRFPNYSVTAQPVGAFADLQPTYVEGLAGKYRIGFGTPFDLSVLSAAHDAALAGAGGFSDEFRAQLISGFDYLDLNAIRYVKLIDIAGDGRERDAEGYSIYDPYPTVITSGFDLDAVAVLNSAAEGVALTFSEWSLLQGMDPIASGDLDKDGWNNYLEYFLDTNPLSSASKPAVSEVLELAEGELYLSLSYSRRANTGNALVIQTSPENGEWTNWEGPRTTRVDPDYPDGRFVRESIRIPLGELPGMNTFIRFLVPGI